MAANLEMISNFLLEKENREKDALRRESADLLAETPSHVLTTLPKESDYIKPEETEGAPSPLPGATQSDTPNTSVQATSVTPLTSSTVKENVAKGIYHIPKTIIPEVATIEKPVIEPVDVDKMKQSQRNNYVQSFATWADAEKAGDISQQEWAYGQIQKMVAEGKNPGEYLNMLSMLGSAETPAEKEKRERREALGETFRGLGNLIGNAANLYNATRGGTPVDLNTANEKRRARMEQIKAKQDALDEKLRETLANAKMSDTRAERAEALENKKAERAAAEKKEERQWKAYYDAYIKEVDNAYKEAQQATKHKNDLEIEGVRQGNREALAKTNHQRIIEREELRGGGSRATIRVPKADGSGYDEYRKNDLNNPIVVSKIYHSLPEGYRKGDSDDTPPTLIKMQAAIGKAQYDGVITEIAPGIKVNSKQGEGSKTPPSKRDKDKKVPPSKRTK